MSRFKILEEFKKFKVVHKSMIFLYPLLKLPDSVCKPLNSYLHLNKEQLYNDRYLFILYNSKQEGYAECRKLLEDSKYWDFKITDSDSYEIHVFTLEEHSEYYDLVISGEYEKIKTPYKLMLVKDNHPVSAIGMSPSYYHSYFVKDFDIRSEELPEGAQLIDKPNILNEILFTSTKINDRFIKLRKGL